MEKTWEWKFFRVSIINWGVDWKQGWFFDNLKNPEIWVVKVIIVTKKTLKDIWISHSRSGTSLRELSLKHGKKVKSIYNGGGALKMHEKPAPSFVISLKTYNTETKFTAKYPKIRIYPEKNHHPCEKF